MKRINKIQSALFCFGLTLLVFTPSVNAQEVENEYQSRVYTTLGFDLIKDLKLELTPELRFDEGFTLDKSLLEAKLEYDPLKYLTLSTAYRFIINSRENKETEYLHRIALGATVKKKFMRFTPGVKLSYSNYADDENTDKEFLRYKAFLKYDIPNCKLTPSLSAEAFQQMNDFDLYKIRYKADLDYKLKKNNYIGASYKFDYFLNDYKNTHIFSVGYKFKF